MLSASGLRLQDGSKIEIVSYLEEIDNINENRRLYYNSAMIILVERVLV